MHARRNDPNRGLRPMPRWSQLDWEFEAKEAAAAARATTPEDAPQDDATPRNDAAPGPAADPPPGSSRYPQRATAWYRAMGSRWARGSAAAFSPATAIGGFVAPAPTGPGMPAPVLTTTRTAQLHVAPVLTHARALVSTEAGDAYQLSPAWQDLAASAGQAAAEHLAGRVADLAAQRAGAGQLDAQLRRYLIQVVLSGIGGLDPDEAADLIELSVDVANGERLLPVIRKLNEHDVPEHLSQTFVQAPPWPDQLLAVEVPEPDPMSLRITEHGTIELDRP